MSQIYCEHPVVIRNPQLKYLLTTYRHYRTPFEDTVISPTIANYWKYSFPEWLFSPKKSNVTSDNIDDFVVINSRTGEYYPMYIQVPCGKCDLCRDKRAREWSFRAICENATSTNVPLFLTLTYNNEHLPKCGIFKEEIQLFMKRMRIRLDRLGVSHNIRYVAVGEYGSRSKRPHYHMILWNFPKSSVHFPTSTSVLNFVEKCWSLNDDSIGFAYCVPCKQGAISYVMKYMRKQYTPPKGMNKLFFLSSRKDGGIGSAYAKRYIEHYRSHPDDTTITATDPYTGYTKTVQLPAYFRYLYFPTLSTVVPKCIRDAHTKLCDLLSKRRSMLNEMNEFKKITFEDCEKQVLKKYFFLPKNISFAPMPYRIDYRKKTFNQLLDMYYENLLECSNLCRYLMLETYDEDYLKIRLELAEKRSRKLFILFDSRPPLDIQAIKYSLNYSAAKARAAEKI